MSGAAPPPPPQVSPDGKFYWDGEKWVPIQQPQPPAPPSAVVVVKQPRGAWNSCVGYGCLAVAVVIALVVALAWCGSKQPSPVSTSQTSTPTSSNTASASAGPKFATFGSGTKVVGQDVQPGTYRTRHPSQNCYLARLKGFSGSIDDIVANENTDGPAVVTIAPTDKGFQSNRCDTWTSDLSAITSNSTSFGDGDFIVGTDMVPGTYRNGGSTGCYWARLSGFSHTIDDIIANDSTDAQAVVTIAPTDKGFESVRCGTWTKIG
jgi:hypothetical protein